MMIRRKTRVLVLAGLAIIAMLLLANGLNGMTLKPGRMLFFSGDFIIQPGEVENLPGGELVIFFTRVVFVLAWIGLPLMVVYLIVSPDARRKLLRFLKRTLPPLLVFITIAKVAQILLQGRSLQEALSPAAGIGGEAAAGEELAPFSGEPPEWLVLITSILLALVLLGLFVLWYTTRQRKNADSSSITRIAHEARAALDEINAGGDLRGTILRCYQDMSQVIQEQRGLARDRAMTTHEFETILLGKGLPEQPLRTLTRLFEDVRYGGIQPGEREEHLAVESLTAIVSAIGGSQ